MVDRTARFGVALFFAVFLASGVSASWQNPGDGDYVNDTSIELNFSAPDADNVTFYTPNGNGGISSNSGSQNGDYYTYSFNPSIPGEGDIELTAETNTSASSADNTTIQITGDFSAPSLDSTSPEEFADTDSPEVSYTASDSLSGVDEDTYEISVNDNDVDESADDNELDLDDLEEGESYEVDYKVLDAVGNELDGSWSFTVDTEYNGDSDPQIPDDSWSSEPNENGIIATDEDVEFEVEFETDDVDEEPSELRCYDGDTDDSDNEIDEDTSYDDGRFECEIDVDDYGDEEIDLEVEFCDEAGNCDTKSFDQSYIVDTEDPFMGEISTTVEVVNGPFEVDYETSDESGIERLEYSFEEEFDDPETVELDSDEEEKSGTFTTEVSELESGEQTLYVRSVDRAGRESSIRELEFEYRPSAEPTLSLKAPSELEVTAGESVEIETKVENTGKLLTGSKDVTASSGDYSETLQVGELAPGTAENLSFSFTPGTSSIGERTVEIAVSSMSASASVPVRVKANEQQRSEIESRLQRYADNLEEVRANVSDLSSKASKSVVSDARSNLSTFETTVQEARTAVEEGRYYAARESLEGVDSQYESTKSAYSSARETYTSNRNRMYILAGVGVLALLGLGAGALFYTSDEYDLHLEKLTDSDISPTSLGGIKSRLNTVLKNEEEAEEFEWDGFS